MRMTLLLPFLAFDWLLLSPFTSIHPAPVTSIVCPCCCCCFCFFFATAASVSLSLIHIIHPSLAIAFRLVLMTQCLLMQMINWHLPCPVTSVHLSCLLPSLFFSLSMSTLLIHETCLTCTCFHSSLSSSLLLSSFWCRPSWIRVTLELSASHLVNNNRHNSCSSLNRAIWLM